MADEVAATVTGESILAAELAAPLNFEDALREVLKNSLVHDGLVRGLKESIKALDRREAHLCVLAESCDEPALVKLVNALCKEHDIPLVKVGDSKMLGEWVGLCRLDADGNAVKVVGCAVAVVKSWGEESPSRLRVLEEIHKMK
eukprot:TRINITY_DN2817_c0_g1_i2.p1 TRINITY_DN2817_c0_g1~~TRINITY_DN2817_c0_g1_i2.p1  ORF type:complete len:144 (+),score=38.89 TRINITY_DN2817_c0_g1_i2:83-514(+)